MDKIKEAENILEKYVALKKAVENLKWRVQKRTELINKKSMPTSADYEQLNQVQMAYQATEAAVEEIDHAIEMMEKKKKDLIVAFYVMKKSYREIMREMERYSTKTFYKHKKKAVEEFADIYFGIKK